MAKKQYDTVLNPFEIYDNPLNFISGGLFHADQNYWVNRHHFDQYLLVYTIEGEGILQYAGKEYHLMPGMVFLIDCHHPHIYRTAGLLWKFCYIHFTAETLQNYVDSLYQRYGAVFFPSNGNFFEHQIYTAIELFRGHDRTAPHRGFGILAELLSMLYSCGQKMEHRKQLGADTIKAMELIETRYNEKITLDIIAQEVGRSKYYLSHQFKADTSISLYKYLTLFRIMKGKSLLQNTNLSIADIAEKIGFESVSNFVHTFSMYESLTPHQYRKQWLV